MGGGGWKMNGPVVESVKGNWSDMERYWSFDGEVG